MFWLEAPVFPQATSTLNFDAPINEYLLCVYILPFAAISHVSTNQF